MAGVRRSCGTVNVAQTDDGRRDTGSPGDGDDGAGGQQPEGPETLPGIGPVTVDNPRFLGAGLAGVVGVGLLLSR